MAFISTLLKNKVGVSLSLFFLFQLLTYSSGAQMRQVYVDNIQADNEIYKISFYSANEGFVGSDYWVGYTTDTGRTFTKKYITLANVNFNGYSVNITFGFAIAGVKAFSQNNLLVYGHYGLVPSILRSTDGGNSFTLIYHSQYDPFQLSTGITDMIFPQNNTIGFAIDADRILKTINQGLSWTVSRVDPGSFFDYLEAVDNNTVFAMSTAYSTNKLLKTTNSGASWQTVILPTLPQGKMTYAHFLNANTGWLSMYDNNNNYYFYKTTNGGTNWTLQNDVEATPFNCYKMKFTDDNTGYGLNGLYTVYKTLNSGVTWEPLPRDNNFTYLGYSHNDLHFFSSTQFWAGGGHGFLELSTNAGGTTMPKAYFKIDTLGLWSTGNVNLLNYSRTSYTYQWLLNGTLISTSYNSSYTHNINRTRDTISLIVYNGTTYDTATKYQDFYPPLLISSFAPTIAGTGNTVTISGSNFTGANSVSFGGVAASSFTVVSANTITAVVGAGASGFVKVYSPTGRDSLAGFTYLPQPTITSFTPTSATAGTTVTITGTNLTAATSVTFGGIAASSYIVVSATTITAVVPSCQSGSVTVVTPGGTASLAGFIALPTITSFTPLQGTQGTIMTITGTSFTGTTAVSIGGVNALSFIINSSTTITAVVGTGASGSVLVTKPGGSSSLPGFTWYDNPVITSFTPISGAIGTTVIITGTGFNTVPANNTVYFGAVKASVTASTATSITVTVPQNATHEPISVLNHNLIAYSKTPFLVTFPNGGSITDNSFATRVVTSTGPNTGPMHIALGDLDGDGKTDLVITGYSTPSTNNGVFIYRNTSTLSTVSFGTPLNIGGLDYVASAVGDLDGDGKLDLAVVKGTSIATYINTSTPGNISFTASAILPTGGSTSGVSIADIDGDGKADIVTPAVLRNTSEPGSISFAPAVGVSIPGGRNIIVIDLDGDNKPEMAIPQGTSDLFSVVKNNSTKGNISFGPPLIFTGYSHSYLSYGDIDGDGKVDLVSSDNNGSKVAVILNTSSSGNISFAPRVEFVATSTPSGIAVSDMDGDGKPDIVTTLINYSLAVLKNTSTPGIASFAPKVDYVAGSYNGQNMVALGDINGDGKNDAIATSEVQHSISVHVNDVKPEPFILSFTPVQGGTGTVVNITGNNFTGVTAVSFGGVAAASFVVNSPTSIIAIVGTGASGLVAVTNNYGTGTRAAFSFGNPPVITSISPAFAPVGSSITISGNYFSPVAANNIVYFGGVKAVVTAATANSITATVPGAAGHQPVTVTTNNLTGYSKQLFSVTFPGGGPSFNASSFAPRIDRSNGGFGTICDLDGDGKLDLAMARGTVGLALARNTSNAGTITFATNVNFPVGDPAFGVATGDLDGDGKLDVVTYSYDSSSIAVARNTSTIGNLSMSAASEYHTGPSTTRPQDAIINDLDGDGKPDIIVANYYSQTLSVFKNLSNPGSITLDARIDYSLNGYPTGVSARDLDGDGKPELIASVNGTNEVSVFLNTSTPGTIAFALLVSFPVGNWPSGVNITDIDGDGKLDIAVSNQNEDKVSVLRNLSTTGNIAFAPKQDLTTGDGPYDVSFGDLDGDGKPDLVEPNFYSGQSLSVFKNISTAGTVAMQPRFNYSLGTNSGHSSIGDIDGDGVPDMVAYVLGGITSFFRNMIAGTAAVQLCANGNTSITSNVTGTTYQWQQNTGSGFANISDNVNFSGTSTITLQINNVPLAWNGYQYRCMVNTTNPSIVTVMTVSPSPVAEAGNDTTICAGTGAQLNASGGTTYSWSPTGGLSNPNIANPVATPAATTRYYVTVYNGFGCSALDSVLVTVTPASPASVSISTPNTTVCNGTLVTFTATPVNGGTNPSYQWKVNGTNTGTNSPTFATSTLVNGDQVSCILTSNASCLSSPTATSNTIIITVTPSVVPSISISTPNTTICSGTLISFTATPVNGGATPVYQWQVNGINTGTNNSTFNTPFLNNNDQVKVIMTSSLACPLPSSVTSNVITMTVNPVPVAQAGNDTTICAGTSAQLNASGGTTYSWSPVGGLSNPNIANPVATPAATTRYYVTVQNSFGCSSEDSVLVTVNSATTTSVTINTPNTSICSGTLVSFTATPVNGGATPAYQWQVNGINTGTNNNVFNTSSINNNDQVKVIMTTSLTCALPATVTSNIITMSVTTMPVANAGNDVTICSGSSTQLQGSGGGTYSWTPATGLTNPNIANPIASPLATTAYILTVANGSCTSKDTVVVTVQQVVTPSVNISISSPSICNGLLVTFTATPVNGGSNPSYQWKINGTNIGTNSPTLVTSILINGDQVSCVLTSNSSCATTPTANSNIISMSVVQLATPIISVSNADFTVTNPDAAANYIWQILANAVWSDVVPFSTGITFTAPAPGEYRVKAVKGPCIKFSSSLTSSFTPLYSHFIDLYPNPAHDYVVLDSIALFKKYETVEIIDMMGKRVIPTINIKNQTRVTIDISRLNTGLYMILVRQRDDTRSTLKFIKQ
jgi:photosystem II stability/assembly factor-like uncharacterized protein